MPSFKFIAFLLLSASATLAQNNISTPTIVTGTNRTTITSAGTGTFSFVGSGTASTIGLRLVSGTSFQVDASDRIIWNTGTLASTITGTLPLASSVPAGTTISIGDISNSLGSSKSISIVRSGTDVIILGAGDAATSGGSYSGTATSLMILEQRGVRAFTSDGSNRWIGPGITFASQFMVNVGTQPGQGFYFSAPWGAAGSLTLETTGYKMRMESARIDLYFGISNGIVGFLQMGRNGFDNSFVFTSPEGSASVSRTAVPGKRHGYTVGYWTGSTAVEKTFVTRPNVDASGNPFMGFYPNGSLAVDTTSPTWPPQSPGTETYAIGAAGGIGRIRLASSATATIYSQLTETGTGSTTWNVPSTGAGNTVSAVLSTLSTNAPDVVNSVWMTSNGVTFEGGTADAFETTINARDAAGGTDKTLWIPGLNGVNEADIFVSLTVGNSPNVANSVWAGDNSLIFEGATANASEGTLLSSDVTADRTWTLPDINGTVYINSGTSAAPVDAVTPVAWTDIVISGTTYKLPLYQ